MKAGYNMLKKSPQFMHNHKILFTLLLTLTAGAFLVPATTANASSNDTLAGQKIPVKEDYKNVIQTRNVTETINYVFEDGTTAAPSVTKNVEFKRMDIQNEDSDIIVNPGGQWFPNKSAFQSVDSPEIEGYTPSQNKIELQKIDPQEANKVFTVIYKKDSVEDVNKPEINSENSNKQALQKDQTSKNVKPVIIENLTNTVKPKAQTTTNSYVKTKTYKEKSNTVRVLPETGEKDAQFVVYLGIMLILVVAFIETHLIYQKN